jgi:hypothetical protein
MWGKRGRWGFRRKGLFLYFFEAFSMKRQFMLDFVKILKDYCSLLSTFAKCCAIIAPSRQQIAIAAQQ